MIHEKIKVIFVHITKTGGCSITKTIGENDNGNPHRNIFDYAKEVNLKDYFSFAFVRNPWDRMVSEYHYQIQRTDGKSINGTFKEYMKRGHPNQICNQLNWIAKDGKILVDFVGRFERLEEDMKTVLKTIGIENEFSCHINKSNHDHYRQYYDDETKEIVRKNHLKDIDFFKYTF